LLRCTKRYLLLLPQLPLLPPLPPLLLPLPLFGGALALP